MSISTWDHYSAMTRAWCGGLWRQQRDAFALSNGSSLVLAILAALAMVAASPSVPTFGSAAAERLVQIGSVHRTAAVTVVMGKSEDVHTDVSFVDVLVGDPEIADVNPLTDHALSILGKKIGTTRVSIYGENKKLIGVFDVEVSYDISTLSDELARHFPNAKLRVAAVNGRIMLTGTAPDAIVLDEALAIAKQFGPDMINAVQVAQAQQVMLEVRFVEASRTAGRDLGLQWNIASNNGRFVTNIGDVSSGTTLPIQTGTPQAIASAGVLSGAQPFGFTVAKLLGFGMEADVLINALETKGLARKLAEPNLVALSGDTASFLAGGEYPIPLVGTFGQISVDYKRYGVSLAFTPTVLNGGLINLKIVPEVSQLDPANSVPIGAGTTEVLVPALTVRRASSTIELRDGQTFVLAGLLNNNLTTAQQQLPWIGDVPVLGALFSSKDYQKQETDLVILVTPHIVRPMRPGDPAKTPLDNTLPANDVDFFLNNQPEVLRTEVRATEAAFGRDEHSGHVLDLPRPVPVAVVDPPRKEFNVFDVSTWGSPSLNARGSRVTDAAPQAVSLATSSPQPDPSPSKVEARVVDVPKRSAIVAQAPNDQSQVLDLPKGDGNAGSQ